ncbi:MDR family MFS transporter [Bacillus alveayuensis]|uniref:MDR family MFS transporter n=1 Tax=Aeribacillus alveayuensis TaxID=279215 RepID=UPI0005CCB153|nr:MFS transporter [Bacillus alveayuensis]
MKRLHPISVNIIIGTLFSRMATFMTFPFLAIYLTKTKGISPVEAGMIIGVSEFVSLFGGFIGGHLSDLYGRKKIMLASIFVWPFVFIGFATAKHVFMFFILNALNGLCRSFFEPSSRALLSDITKQENKLFVFNLRYAAINVGAAVGPLIGLKIGSATSTTAFWMTALVYVLYGISLFFMFQRIGNIVSTGQSSNQERPTFMMTCRMITHDKILLLSLVGMTLGIAGFSQFKSTIPQYLSSAPYFQDGVQLFSYLIVVNAITVLIAQYPVSRIGKYYSPVVSIMLGTVTVGLGLFLFGLFHQPWLLVMAMVIFTIGEVMMFTMSDLFIDQIAKPNMKGLYFGAMGFTAIGSAFGPTLGGFFISIFGFSHADYLFGSLALLSFAGFPFLLYVSRMIKAERRDMGYSL